MRFIFGSRIHVPSRLHWATLGHTGPRRATLGHARSHWVTLGHAGPRRATLGHTGSHRATQGHTGSHWAMQGHTGPHRATLWLLALQQTGLECGCRVWTLLAPRRKNQPMLAERLRVLLCQLETGRKILPTIQSHHISPLHKPS